MWYYISGGGGGGGEGKPRKILEKLRAAILISAYRRDRSIVFQKTFFGLNRKCFLILKEKKGREKKTYVIQHF